MQADRAAIGDIALLLGFMVASRLNSTLSDIEDFMHFKRHPSDAQVQFTIENSDNDIEDQLAFIHLVEMKFEGQVVEANVQGKGKTKALQYKINFSRFQDSVNAEVHCKDKLTQSGSVSQEYKGALDYADPGRKMARRLRARADSEYAKSIA